MKTRTFRFISIAILCLNQAFCGLFLVPVHALNVMQPDKADNILANGDFDGDDILPWWLFVNTAGGAIADAVIDDGWCIITNITLAGEHVDWYVQFTQTFTAEQVDKLQSGETYVLTFDAFSEKNNRPCNLYLGLDDEPWTPYLAESFFINDQPGTFRFEFTVNTIFPAIKLSFNLGQDDAKVKYDNIRLEQKQPDIPARQQVIASSGTHFENSSGSLAFTLGEPITATLAQDDIILTQGLHQAEITVIPYFTGPNLNFEITAYPNPAYDFVILKTDRFEGLHYILYSLEGNVIQQSLLNTDYTEINFSALKPSVYLLNIIEGDKILKTFKIIKK